MGRLTPDEFKQGFDLREYVSEYDYEMRGDKMFISCPFHPDKTPSCLISQDHYYCFGCGQNGDSIDFVMNVAGLSFLEVLNNANNLGYDEETNIRPRKKYSYRNIAPAVVDSYNRTLLSRAAKIRYLSERQVDIKTINNAKLGWGYPKNFRKFTHPRYTIPIYGIDGSLVTIKYRIDPEFDNGKEPKYLAHPRTRTALYNSHIIPSNNEILVVGSELDAAFLYHRYEIAAISPPGENVFKPEWGELFSGKNILLLFDNDKAGVYASMNAYYVLQPYAARVKIFHWPHGLPNKYDVGDLVKENGIGIIDNILEEYDVEAYAY